MPYKTIILIQTPVAVTIFSVQIMIILSLEICYHQFWRQH